MNKEEMIKASFFKMGEAERKKVKLWYDFITYYHEDDEHEVTNAEKDFICIVKMALRLINYDYEIACLEPSDGENGLYYKIGEEIVGDKNSWYYRTWRDKAKRFAPEYNSRLANLYELFLWYAYRIAMTYWSLDEVCNKSSKLGNYSWGKDATGAVEVSGARECAGFCDGIGNTYKLVTLENSFCSVGGSCYDRGILQNVSYVEYGYNANDYGYRTSGVLVLTR